MGQIRFLTILIGILMPFLTDILAETLKSSAPDFALFLVTSEDPNWRRLAIQPNWPGLLDKWTPGAILFLFLSGSLCWGSILLATMTYRYAASALFPFFAGFGFLTYAYLMNTFNPDAQGALVYLFGPIYSTGFVFLGWLCGLYLDRARAKAAGTPPSD